MAEQEQLVILADVSYTMAVRDAGRRGEEERIAVLRRGLGRALAELPHARILAFASDVAEVNSPAVLPEPEGWTDLARALRTARRFRPGFTLVISDGDPDDKVEALAARDELPGCIGVHYCGPSYNHEAIAFMQRLVRGRGVMSQGQDEESFVKAVSGSRGGSNMLAEFGEVAKQLQRQAGLLDLQARTMARVGALEGQVHDLDLRQTMLGARQALGGTLDGQALDVMTEMQREAEAATQLRGRERALVRGVVQETGNRLGAASRGHFEQLAVDAAARMLAAPSAGAPVAFDDFKPRPDAIARARELLSASTRAAGQLSHSDFAPAQQPPPAETPKQLPAPGQPKPKPGLLGSVLLLLAPPRKQSQ